MHLKNLTPTTAFLSRSFALGGRALASSLAAALLLGALPATRQDPAPEPLPKGAEGPTIPAKGYLVREIKDGVYWVTNGLYDAMFVVHEKGVIAVDAPPTLGENYLKAIRDITPKPVTHLVYTHSHSDHIGAAHLFPKGIPIVAHRETADILRRRRDTKRPVPTVLVDRKRTLEVGGQRLELVYKGPNHEPGNLFVFAPKQKVLMLVDVVYPGWVPYKNLGISKDVPEYIKAHDDALSFPFETLVAGHVGRLGNRQDVQISKEFINDLVATVGKAFQKVDFGKSAAKTGTVDKWKMYETYVDTVVKTAVDELLPRWKGRLAGADTYMRDNVWAVAEALTVDFAAPQGTPK